MKQTIISFLRRFRNNLYNLPILLASYRRSNKVIVSGAYIRHVRVSINGSGNTLYIHPSCQLLDSHISLSCNNSAVVIWGGVFVKDTKILVMDDGCNLVLKGNTSINGADFWLTEGRTITIDEDCMFARNIEMRVGDNHAIFDNYTGKRLNSGKDIHVGRHVWIGANVRIMKGAYIPEGSVIGNGSIVTKPLATTNSIYVGSPARLVKENIRWERDKKFRMQQQVGFCTKQTIPFL